VCLVGFEGLHTKDIELNVHVICNINLYIYIYTHTHTHVFVCVCGGSIMALLGLHRAFIEP
jgi:hypothetical protein